LSIYLIKQPAMNKHWEVGCKLHASLSSALYVYRRQICFTVQDVWKRKIPCVWQPKASL